MMVFRSSFKNHASLVLIVSTLFRCSSVPPPPPPRITQPVEVKPETIPLEPPLPPEALKINSVKYNLNEMIIEWEITQDPDFESYRLFQSKGTKDDPDTIFVSSDAKQTQFVLNIFDPKIENWFWINAKHNTGLNTNGPKKCNPLETQRPTASTLKTFEGKYDLQIHWTSNYDNDFKIYRIFRSRSSDMKDEEVVIDIFSRLDTNHVLALDDVFFYQVETIDHWGLASRSNVIKGDYNVKIFGENFSMVNTKKIDLVKKKLFGPIPKDIGKLFNLEVLLLQNNFLTGNIPKEIWDLKKIRIINFSKNQFIGKIPLGIHKLECIEEIWLANNNFEGEIPHQIFTLKNLTHLNLSGNNISGNISEAVANLENLLYLNFFDNNLSGSIPGEIGELENLEFLSLGRNQLTGNIPQELAGAINLESIALFENQLVGSIPKGLMELENLVYLGLFDNQLVGSVSNKIFDKSNLSYLRLNKNNLEKVNYDSLCESGYDWSNSIYFDLSENDFKEKIPECFSGPVFFEIHSSFNKR